MISSKLLNFGISNNGERNVFWYLLWLDGYKIKFDGYSRTNWIEDLFDHYKYWGEHLKFSTLLVIFDLFVNSEAIRIKTLQKHFIFAQICPRRQYDSLRYRLFEQGQLKQKLSRLLWNIRLLLATFHNYLLVFLHCTGKSIHLKIVMIIGKQFNLMKMRFKYYFM